MLEDVRSFLAVRFLALLLAILSAAPGLCDPFIVQRAGSTQAPKGNSQGSPTPRPTVTLGRVVNTQLSARAGNPDKALCPAQEDFIGSITTNGAAEVTYTWVSSDGATWPQVRLHFSGASTQSVNEHARAGKAGETTHGWMQLKVLSPNARLSPRAQYSVTVLPTTRLAPHYDEPLRVTRIPPWYPGQLDE